jgi:hypothetical protein
VLFAAFELQPKRKLKLQGSRLLRLPRLGCACCFQLLPLHQHTALHRDNQGHHCIWTFTPRTINPYHCAALFRRFHIHGPVEQELGSDQGHGVFGLVDSTNKTVGDTARHCDQSLLSFSLFPGSVCEHCLFLFCTLASVRIDHGTRADKRVGWDGGSLCSEAFSLTCTYSDKL